MARYALYARPLVFILAVVLASLFVARTDAGPPPPPFAPVYVPGITSPVAGAHTDTTVDFSLPSGNFNFSAVIGFVPADMGVGACPANMGPGGSLTTTCADDSIPDGAVLGQVTADATLGLINGVCNSPANDIPWTMLDATTDMSSTVIFEDDPVDADDVGEQFEDDNGDGLQNGVTMYPEYLTRLIHGPQVWDAMDPGSAPLQPMQRTYGHAVVANTDVSLQFLLMQPGITINGLALPAAAGYPLITVLQNIGDPGAVSTPQTITDNCSPLTSQATTYGISRDNPNTVAVDEGAFNELTVPDPGTYDASALLFSNRDEDADGIENQMDTCATMANTGTDADTDGLDSACDPNDAVTNSDQDGDGFLNRGDNCPINADTPGATAQDDVDRDGIGNLCDPAPTTPSALIYFWPPTYPASIDLGDVVVTGPVMGDTNCAAPVGTVNAVDALQVLRRNAGLEPRGACSDNAEANVDCSGSGINAVDALKILRHSASLPVVQIGPEPDACPDIGTALP